MVRCILLKSVGNLQQVPLLKSGGDELHPHRKPVHKTAGQRDGRKTGQVDGHCINIGKIKDNRVI